MKFARSIVIFALALAVGDVQAENGFRRAPSKEAVDVDEEYWQRYLQTQTSVPVVISKEPSGNPSTSPTVSPSDSPSLSPSEAPSSSPSGSPTNSPSDGPTNTPTTPDATSAPTVTTPAPTIATSVPSISPSGFPSEAPVPGTLSPTVSTPAPSTSPTISTPEPSGAPSFPEATNNPTITTEAPSNAPSGAPTAATNAPTASPSGAPSDATAAPSGLPSSAPTAATDAPSTSPSGTPTAATSSPSAVPSQSPSDATPSPTSSPSSSPTDTPSGVPSAAPSVTPQPPVVQQRLLPFVLQGGAEFEDPESYQSKALGRTEEQIGVDTFSDEKLVQYYALYCIYNATNKVPNLITLSNPEFDDIEFPSWFFATGWEETDLDPCDGWFGVTCDAEGRVSQFQMIENFMTGVFPPEITLLASDGPAATGAGALTFIEVFNNPFLFNNFDSSWITNLGSELRILFLGLTGFAGELPALPSGLTDVDFAFSLYDAGFTNENFETAPTLEYVNLGGNAFNSTVPTVFSSLPELQFFYVFDCLISGDLSYMQGMPKIFEHWIDLNPQLGGPIFDFIGSLSTLASFSVTQSSLSGEIPTVLGQLSNMQRMWFYDNDLTGQIPTELGLLRRMGLLQLEGNAFTGSMPSQICDNTGFIGPLDILGSDCLDVNFECSCCTCCSLLECNPEVYG